MKSIENPRKSTKINVFIVFTMFCHVVARSVELRMAGFKMQNLANTAWAFAKVKYRDE